MPFLLFHRGRAVLSAMLLWFVFLALLVTFAVIFPKAITGDFGRYVYGAIGTVVAVIATAFVVRANKCTWAETGLRWSGRTGTTFLAGLAIGLALFSATLLLIYITTGIRPTLADGVNAATLVPLGALLPLALMEEIAFRGYAFAQLWRQYGVWIAQMVTALAFAAYHVLNGWPLVMSFLGPGVWAFVFGIAAARSGGIAMPTGIHFGINVAQALVGLGTATASMAVFRLTDARGLTGASVADQTTPAGLVAQALILTIAIILTYRLARHQLATSEGELLPPGRDKALTSSLGA